MKFEWVEQRLHVLNQKERTRKEEFERDVIVAMYQALDVIRAFEVGNRKPTQLHDLGELVMQFEVALNLIKHAIKCLEALEKEGG